MKIYSIGAGRRWARTQEEAKRLAKDLGVNFAAVDVPTDHAGLAQFLDSLARGNEPEDELVDDGDGPNYAQRSADMVRYIERSIADTEKAAAQTLADIDGPLLTGQFSGKLDIHPDAVVEWVMDTATPVAIEKLFEALGVRFHEMRKGAR